MTDKEKLGLYLLLSYQEEKLDDTMQRLKQKLENWLYEKVDIFQMNELDKLYMNLKEGDNI
ncbi:hypothetical protein WKV44_04240 [Spirochaetia bacterium 38H-sp]|uniref:Uncharacterized protein n=1 Tax=Rarispira pelagica TaxID=3141764 RepID=A0ABU9UAR3_9SPIR